MRSDYNTGISRVNGKLTRLYSVWNLMKQRCFNINSSSYAQYGKRGITVCDEWMTFKNFHDWAHNNGYEEHLTLDRINNNGNYGPKNCRFISHQLNCQNTRVVKLNREIIKNIHKDFKSGKYKKADLARKYNLTRAYVGEILSGKRWGNYND